VEVLFNVYKRYKSLLLAETARKTAEQLVNRKADLKKKHESIRIDLFKMNRRIDSNRESECTNAD